MSHQAVINYEAIAIECQSICEVASKQLCQIDKMLEKIDSTSKSLQGEETQRLKDALKAKASSIQEKINNIIRESEVIKQKGLRKEEADYRYASSQERYERNIAKTAEALKNEVNNFITKEIAAYNVVLDNLLAKKIEENKKNFELRIQGIVLMNDDFKEKYNSLEDDILKSFIYIEHLNENNYNKSFEELKDIAETKLKNGVENYFKKEKTTILKDIEAELRSSKIDENTISSIINTKTDNLSNDITLIREKATNELVGESVRKKTLKIVIECVEKRGFIVDRKNIKIQKEENKVVLIAKKASGEKAEFEVMLDGKFIYHFDGYEGQACQNDIKPFMDDLENIYGIKVKSKEEIWSNPDKVSTMKYQEMNTNKNKK